MQKEKKSYLTHPYDFNCLRKQVVHRAVNSFGEKENLH